MAYFSCKLPACTFEHIYIARTCVHMCARVRARVRKNISRGRGLAFTLRPSGPLAALQSAPSFAAHNKASSANRGCTLMHACTHTANVYAPWRTSTHAHAHRSNKRHTRTAITPIYIYMLVHVYSPHKIAPYQQTWQPAPAAQRPSWPQ